MKCRLAIFVAVLHMCLAQQYQQKVAPGVPPQNYQNYQPPPPPPPQQNIPQQQQYQQVPQQQQQYQQVPQQQQQYQQVPQQQQYQQQVPVQPPQHQQQHGGHDPSLLNPANMEHEKEHIQEHMEIPMDVSKMSQAELQFHYFKMHDADNNNKLDGCELIKSLIHWHDPSDPSKKVEYTVGTLYTDQELEQTVETVFKHLDKNDDGYIDWMEYKSATA